MLSHLNRSRIHFSIFRKQRDSLLFQYADCFFISVIYAIMTAIALLAKAIRHLQLRNLNVGCVTALLSRAALSTVRQALNSHVFYDKSSRKYALNTPYSNL
jgi:MFS-type transporter involved in bile tolerance (Atg22 family)